MLWFFLWLIFAAAVLVFMGWSLNILLAQKKAWGQFAAKYKLEAVPNPGLFKPLWIRGALQGRNLNIYSQTETNEGQRMSSSYTHIEVFLNNLPPALCILAKKPLPLFLSDLSLPQILTMSSPEWPKPAVAMTDDPIKLANWLSDTRLKAFKAFMDGGARGDEPILINDGDQAFLLWRTSDPLRDPRQLNAVVQKMFGWAKELDAS